MNLQLDYLVCVLVKCSSIWSNCWCLIRSSGYDRLISRTIYTGWLGPKYGFTTFSRIDWGLIGRFASMGLRRRWAQVPVATIRITAYCPICCLSASDFPMLLQTFLTDMFEEVVFFVFHSWRTVVNRGINSTYFSFSPLMNQHHYFLLILRLRSRCDQPNMVRVLVFGVCELVLNLWCVINECQNIV